MACAKRSGPTFAKILLFSQVGAFSGAGVVSLHDDDDVCDVAVAAVSESAGGNGTSKAGFSRAFDDGESCAISGIVEKIGFEKALSNTDTYWTLYT